jgi:hypothetical protein
MSNPEAAIWLLERMVNKAELSNGLEQLMDKSVLIPLFLFIHSG